jgi:Trk K+ transport system NAD-binding subunit
MAGHSIVCGMGDVGYRIAELLQRLGEPVVVITEQVLDDRRLTAEAFGVRVIQGDARSDRLLREAGVESAKTLIAATDKDLVNIEVALDGRRMQPGLPVVVRLFDQMLTRQLEDSLDIRRALGMAALAAPSFTAKALGDGILAGLSIGEIPYVVGRQVVENDRLANCTTAGDVARRHRLLSLMRERPGEERASLPDDAEPLRSGDRLSLLGRKEDWDAVFPSSGSSPGALDAAEEKPPLRQRVAGFFRRAAALWLDQPLALRALFVALCLLVPVTVLIFHYYFALNLADSLFFSIITLHGEIGLTDTGPQIKMYEILLMVLGSLTLATVYSMLTDFLVGSRLRKILGGQAVPRSGHIVVVGLGRVGFRVVNELTELGVPVVAVDVDADSSFLSSLRTKVPLVVGDARVEETLVRANLATARAVVAATNDDAVNLGVGIAAKRMSPEARTVVRLFDAGFARKVESSLGIDAALSASRIAAPTFAAAALYPDVVKAFIVRDRLFILLWRPAGAEWAGARPSALRAEQEIRILWRDGALATPGLTDADRPLKAEENVLAGLWRRLTPAWAETP